MKIPPSPPEHEALFTRAIEEGDPQTLGKILSQGALARGKYRHWDKVLHLSPPAGLTVEQWWIGIKWARGKIKKPVPLLDKDGEPFSYAMPDPIQAALHDITQQASGRLEGTADAITNTATRDRYVISSLIDEAITSSQLEGAATTTRVAKEMLRSGRRPRDRGEQMILNNYRAMRFVQDFADAKLTPDLLYRLHELVTEDTLDDPSKAGQLRTESDHIVVNDPTDGTTLHVPPAASELGDRIDRLCDFANGQKDKEFMHPVVRAIILHFCIGYDHPFVDGNGRTARALFYWSMLQQGYWMAQFISISSILARAPASYARSYLYTETDDNDLTYFLDYQLQVIQRAIAALSQFLERKAEEVRQVEALAKGAGRFNHRQLALLGHALRHPGARYTFDSHRRSHNVVYQTARTDLLGLSKHGLLIDKKIGRSYQFDVPSNLPDRLRHLSEED